MNIKALLLSAALAASGLSASGWAQIMNDLAASEPDWVEALQAMQTGGALTPRDCILLGMLNPGVPLPPECEEGGVAPEPTPPAEQAMTVWWAIFNNPEHCGSTPCQEADLFEPAVEGTVTFATGGITDADGNARYVASIYETDPVSFADVDPNTAMLRLFDLPAGPGLLDAERAEIHLVVRSHGPAASDDTAALTEQITTFVDARCEDAGGPNPCVDVQIAVFTSGDSGVGAVLDFADLSVVEGATAELLREPSAIKFVIDTQIPPIQ